MSIPDSSHLPPETELLLQCVQILPDKTRISALLHSGLDWNRLLWEARWHRLTPLLHHHLKSFAPVCVPPEIAKQTKEAFAANVHFGLQLSGNLLRILSALENADIPAVPVRGPAMSDRLYPTPGLRQLTNLNLIVKSQDEAAIAHFLLSFGYTAAEMRGHFKHEEPLFHLRLLSTLTSEVFSAHPSSQDFWHRLERTAFHARSCLQLTPEDLLVLLCNAGTARQWHRLDLIGDVARLLDTHPHLDWNQVFDSAGARAFPILLGLTLAQALVQTPLPDEVDHPLQAHNTIEDLKTQILDRLLNPSRDNPGFLSRTLFQCRLHDSFWQKGRFVLSHIARRLPRIPNRIKEVIQRRRDFGEYAPTCDDVVGKMLELAEIQPEDVLYDLGCGDGRIVVAAARDHGIPAVGVDLDAERISEANANAHKAGLEDRVRFIQSHAKDVDLSEATIVISYLRTYGNIKLLPKLRRELGPDARVITRDFTFGDLLPSKTLMVSGGIRTTYLYLWQIGAQ